MTPDLHTWLVATIAVIWGLSAAGVVALLIEAWRDNPHVVVDAPAEPDALDVTNAWRAEVEDFQLWDAEVEAR